MKRIVLILTVVLTIVAALTANGMGDDESKTGEGEQVTLTYFTFSAAPDHLGDLDEMIMAFNAEYPNVEIEVETAPWGEYFTKLQTLVAGRSAPDVFELNYENFITYASKNVLKDLGPMVRADASFSADVFYPRAYGAFNHGGTQYGLPETFSTVVLFYNKDLFDEADVGYPEADWTWDDAITAGKAIADPANDIWGVYSPIQFWEFYKKVAQNKGTFFSPDGKSVTLNSPENIDALETMLSMMDEHKIMPTAAEMGGVSDGDLFLSGKLGMLVSGIWMFGAFSDADFAWDIELEPGMATKATHFFANAVVVSDDTKYPDASWQWAKFFASSPKMAEIRVRGAWELPTLSNEAYLRGYLEQSPPDNRQAVFDSLNYAIVPPVIERQNEMQDVVGAQLELAILGQISAAEAMKRAQVAVEELIR